MVDLGEQLGEGCVGGRGKSFLKRTTANETEMVTQERRGKRRDGKPERLN